MSVIEPWGKLEFVRVFFKKRNRVVSFGILKEFLSGCVSNTEICGQPLGPCTACVIFFFFFSHRDVATARKFNHDVMSDEVFHLGSLRGPPCFLPFFHVGFTSTFLARTSRPVVVKRRSDRQWPVRGEVHV